MFKYNFCLFKKNDEILLLNRIKSPWMGCWNGIGGKLEKDEMPRDAMIREIEEETGIQEYALNFKGVVTWTWNNTPHGGMYIYLADISDEYRYETPLVTEEGILDWKKIDWILDPENAGIAKNIPSILNHMLNDDKCYNHHCVYDGDDLVKWEAMPIDRDMEAEKDIETILNRQKETVSDYTK